MNEHSKAACRHISNHDRAYATAFVYEVVFSLIVRVQASVCAVTAGVGKLSGGGGGGVDSDLHTDR